MHVVYIFLRLQYDNVVKDVPWQPRAYTCLYILQACMSLDYFWESLRHANMNITGWGYT